ncbi:XRE family transcriptional regulator [Azospirillaceae bacterium]
MINKALRLIRVYHDLNQADTAERVGLSKSYVSEIENGYKKVTMEVLSKYSIAFSIPMSSLMLFAEKAEDGRFSQDARTYIADKALKMLDWIATISVDHHE